MTSSTSCSSSARLLALALAGAVAGLACGGRSRPPDERRFRVAVLPPDNLSGATVPARELRAAVELALARRGVEVVSGDLVERFLARYRMRYTGGVDGAAARAAGEDMGVDGVVIVSVEQYVVEPPRLALTLRLVGAAEDAPLLWMDGVARAGDEAPGLLGLGIIRELPGVEERVLRLLADSMGRFLEKRGPAAPQCPDGRRFRPRIPYRSELLDARKERYTVAVVPFRNLTNRRGAGEVVSLTFVRQLMAVPNFKVLEPGAVRDLLLRYRIIMEGGVSVDQVRSILGALGADLVVAGDVVEFAAGGVPSLNYSMLILDGHSGRTVWQSTSYNRGDDGVFFFDAGLVSTASALTCRMVRSTVDAILDTKPTRTPALPSPGGELSPMGNHRTQKAPDDN